MLELVREGMPNAEIAVRLGLSVNTVKYHVSNLLTKAGVDSREELRGAHWKPRPERRHAFWPAVPLWLKLASGVAGLAVAGVGAAAYFSAAPGQTVSDERPIPAGFERPSAAELLARGMVDAGPLFLGNEAVAGIQMRDDLTVVQGEPGALVVVGIEGSLWEKTASGESGTDVAEMDVTGRIGNLRYNLVIGGWGMGDLRPVPGGPGQATIGRFELVPASRPAPAQLLLDLSTATDHAHHAVAVASNGHLFIDPAPIADDLVADYLTGRAVTLAPGSVSLPAVSTPGDTSAAGETFCSDGLCEIVWTGGSPAGIRAPIDGQLACTGDGLLALTPTGHRTGETVVRFDELVMIVGGAGHVACDGTKTPRAVVAGEQIGYAGRWVITASDADGKPLSVGIDGAGRLYIGVEAPSPACPCRGTT